MILRSTQRLSLLPIGLALLLVWSLGLRVWFASHDLTENRYWDERFGLDNVHSLVEDGQIRPANGFHPTLSYLPEAAVIAGSDLLYRATGAALFQVFDTEARAAREGTKEPGEPAPGERWRRQQFFTPTGYFLTRFVQVLFGVASLYLVFLIGRRIFSPPVGLLAALLLSGVTWHLRQSAIFKPDILVILTILLAFYLSLEAAERPSRKTYLKAAFAIGLALSTKFNAAPVAVPLLWATIVNGRRDRRVWMWLALAGALSVAVFLALNPFVLLDTGLYRQHFGRTLEDYAAKGARYQSSHLYVLWHGVLSILSPALHGKVVGLVGLVGAAALLLVPTTSRERRLGCQLGVAYLVGYAAIYSLSTTNPSPHNWLLVSPLVALFAAASLHEAWKWGADRWPLLLRPPVVGLLALVVTAWSITPSFLFSYRTLVPTTQDEVEDYLEARLGNVEQRVVVHERTQRPFRVAPGGNRATALPVDSLARVEASDLDLADAEVFLLERPADEPPGDSAFLEQRLSAATGDSSEIIEARWFRHRGPALAVLTRRWRRNKVVDLEPTSLTPLDQRLTISLPEIFRANDVLTLELDPPRELRVRALTLNGQPLSYAVVRHRREDVFRSARFVLPSRQARIVVELERLSRRPSGRRELRASVHRWRLR